MSKHLKIFITGLKYSLIFIIVLLSIVGFVFLIGHIISMNNYISYIVYSLGLLGFVYAAVREYYD